MNGIIKMLKSEKGFTLLELVLVVIILAILAGVALLNLGSTETDAKMAKAKTDMDALTTALKVYKVKIGSYPASLTLLTTDSGNYKAMLDQLPKDPFRNNNSDYKYTTGATYSISSNDAAGPTAITLK